MERRLRLVLPAHAARQVAGLLRSIGALEVALEPAGEREALVARFAAEEPRFLEDRVEAWLHSLDPKGQAALETAAGEGLWQPGWRAVYAGAVIGPFRIRPPWAAAGGDRLDVMIDPRGAFGSGLH